MTEAVEIRRWLVRGHVQGVGFRMFVQREASQLGLRGHVRNSSDGAVAVLACGAAAMLDRLADRLAQGPPASRVSSVETQPHDGSIESLPAGFAISS